MPTILERLTRVRREEVGALTWALIYGFCIFLAYYILRPVRDEISSADRGNLQILWTVVFLVMLVAVPAYSWVVARWPRGVFVPWVNRFFILNLVGFYAALGTTDKQIVLVSGQAHNTSLGINRHRFWHVLHGFLTMPGRLDG